MGREQTEGENRVLRIFGRKKQVVPDDGENYRKKSFVICTSQQIFLGYSNRGG
jgi:hypothetical protein